MSDDFDFDDLYRYYVELQGSGMAEIIFTQLSLNGDISNEELYAKLEQKPSAWLDEIIQNLRDFQRADPNKFLSFLRIHGINRKPRPSRLNLRRMIATRKTNTLKKMQKEIRKEKEDFYSAPLITPPLNSITNTFLDKIKTKYDWPVMVLYIDSHGLDTDEKICSLNSSKVISISGVFGAVTYAHFDENAQLGTVRDRNLIKQIISPEINTSTVETVFETIGKELKRENIKSIKNIEAINASRNEIDKSIRTSLTLKSIDEELVGDIVYQMHDKSYVFMGDRQLFDFGIHVVDVIFPESWKHSNLPFIKDKIATLKSLIGMNLISEDFTENGSILHKTLFNAPIRYLHTLHETAIEDGYPEVEPGLAIREITYLELVEFIELFGINYMYLIDSSCRNTENPPSLESIDDYIIEERKHPNILQKIQKKAKSTSPKSHKKRKLESPESISNKTRKIHTDSFDKNT